MRIPLSWLRDYVRVDATPAQIAEALSIAAAEVEGDRAASACSAISGCFASVMCSRPRSTRTPTGCSSTSVDVGEDRPYSIVCGAWNFGAGAKVAVALPGATLPNGLLLERRKLRGQVSEGMILAEDELDLGTDHSGIIVLDDALEAGRRSRMCCRSSTRCSTSSRPGIAPISSRSTASRARSRRCSAASCAAARDRSAAGRRRAGRDRDRGPRGLPPLRRPPLPRRRDRRVAALAEGAAAACRRPPISNVVDVTNYVMLALGSPLHAYDLDLLHGGLVARRARTGREVADARRRRAHADRATIS